MILYFSGTGNSAYAAEKLGEELKDETVNLFEKIRDHDFSEMHSDKPWIVVSPTYAWRLPRILQEWLANTRLAGNKQIYFVMTCDSSIGNAGEYAEKLSESKGLDYSGCIPIPMPENYIALFHAPTREQALKIISQAEDKLSKVSQLLKNGTKVPPPSVTFQDRINSGVVNALFYPLFVHAKKFYSTEDCISCGKCAKVCPLQNIHLEKGRPVWADHCTHCMACINRCPSQAIEYGQHSKGLERYTCPKNV